MIIAVQSEEAASRATMTCDGCGSVSLFDASLPYIKQGLTFRAWHLEHSDCAPDPIHVDLVAASPT